MKLRTENWWVKVYKAVYQIDNKELPTDFWRFFYRSLLLPIYFLLAQPMWVLTEVANSITKKKFNNKITQVSVVVSIVLISALMDEGILSLKDYFTAWGTLLLFLLVVGIFLTIICALLLYILILFQGEIQVKRKIVTKIEWDDSEEE